MRPQGGAIGPEEQGLGKADRGNLEGFVEGKISGESMVLYMFLLSGSIRYERFDGFRGVFGMFSFQIIEGNYGRMIHDLSTDRVCTQTALPLMPAEGTSSTM